MTEKEFHEIRKPFYLDLDTLLVKFPSAKYLNTSHAVWFNELGIQFLHTVRGYYMKTEEDEYIMLYWNDFEIPNITSAIFTYLFEYFPDIKWIGMGCHKGKIGEIWKPKLIITRNNP